jgi:hypothetical protein
MSLTETQKEQIKYYIKNLKERNELLPENMRNYSLSIFKLERILLEDDYPYTDSGIKNVYLNGNNSPF